jgi:hypothetical protein
MSKQLSLKTVTQMFFTRVEKDGEGWKAVVYVKDQQELANKLLVLKKECEARGIDIPQEGLNRLHTEWVYNSQQGFPQFIVKARSALDSKCVALAMLMYGSKPSKSYTWDCLRKADVKLLDRVSGICGENTMYMCKEITGLKIPFALPESGFIPRVMDKVIAKYCFNDEKGQCAICRQRVVPGVIKGKTYECGNFVHDACAIGRHFSEYCREKTWMFACRCGVEHQFTSSAPMFNAIRLTIMTGDNVPALEANMEKYRKNGDDPVANVPKMLLAKAVRSMLNNVGLQRHSVRVNDMMDDCMYYLKMPDHTKAGAWFQDGIYSFFQNGEESKNKQNPTKTEVEVIAGHKCRAYVAALKEEFKEFIFEGGSLDTRKLQDFAWKRIFAFKMNTKVEALVVQDDADKLRMFFPSHVCKFIFDNILWKNLVAKLYQQGSVMLGFRWLDGGAQKLFNRYKNFKKFMAWDISGLDSSMKAKIIQIIFEALFHAYDPKSVSDESFKIFHLIYMICVGHYVSKVVAWVDHFRIMVGSMASGELMTSIFNTIYCIVAIFSWMHHIADLKFGVNDNAPGKAVWVKTHIEAAVLLVFGDDGLMGTDEDELSLFDDVSIGGVVYPSLDTFLKKFWKMSIKAKDSIQTTTLKSVPNEFGDLPESSVTILKRGFVEVVYKGKKVIGPFKSTSITIGKLLKHEVSANKVFSKSHCAYLMMCRAVGHAVDSAGVNRYMYDVCKYTYDVAFASFTEAVGMGEVDISVDDMRQIEQDSVGNMNARVSGKVVDVAPSYDVVRFPSWEELQDMFLEVRDEEPHVRNDQAVRRQKHFNDRYYGVAALDME